MKETNGLDGRVEYRCVSCGNGVAPAPPATCPRCKGTQWVHGTRPPRNPLFVTRLASSTFLLTPPPEIDAAAASDLAAAVADIAFEQPDLILDLSQVRVLDERAAKLLLHLGALSQGAGGRLLAVCPSVRASGISFHELAELDDEDADQIGGALGRALRALRRGEGKDMRS